jgi:hypothetical protein
MFPECSLIFMIMLVSGARSGRDDRGAEGERQENGKVGGAARDRLGAFSNENLQMFPE